MIEKIFKRLAAVVFIVSSIALTNPVSAQMFSVGEAGPRYSGPLSEFYIGLESMDATYKGGPIPGETGEGAFEYSGPVIKAGYNTSGLDLYLSAGGKVTGVDDVSYFHTGGNFDFGISLYRNQKVRLQVPIRISSRYTNITSNQRVQFQTINRFQFGMVSVGAGFSGEWKPTKKVRAKVGAVPGYGFSFASGGFFGGSVGVVDAYGKLYFDRLYNNLGLSLGYKYDFRTYDVEDDIYDYDLRGHSFEIGVTF